MGCSSVSRTSLPAGSGEPSSNSGAGWLASSTTTSAPTSINGSAPSGTSSGRLVAGITVSP